MIERWGEADAVVGWADAPPPVCSGCGGPADVDYPGGLPGRGGRRRPRFRHGDETRLGWLVRRFGAVVGRGSAQGDGGTS